MLKRQLKNIELCARDAQIFVRCSVALKAAISQSADRSARSLTAEVILRLLRSLEDYEFIPHVSDQHIEG